MYANTKKPRNPKKRPATNNKKKVRRSVAFHARAHILESPAINEPLIREPRILLFDTENSPILGHAWQRYDTTLVNVVDESFLMAFSAKWLGQSPTICRVLPDYARYRTDPKDDSDLVRELRQLIDQADILVGHNIRRHDVPKFQSACLRHSLTPPSPFKIFDTLKLAAFYPCPASPSITSASISGSATSYTRASTSNCGWRVWPVIARPGNVCELTADKIPSSSNRYFSSSGHMPSHPI